MDRTTRTLGHVKKGRDTFTMERPNISSMNEGEERTTMVNGVLTTYRKQQNQLWLNEWIKQGITDDQTLGTITRADLTQEDTVPYPIPLTAFRLDDGTVPTTTGTTNKPRIVVGFSLAGVGYFQGFGDAQTTKRDERLFFDFALPECYVSASTVTVSISCGWIDYGTNTLSPKTIDCLIYEVEEDGTAGADICATVAQTMTGETVTGYDFSVTATDLVAGDLLRVHFVESIQGSTAGALYAKIGGATIKLSIKG